MVIEALNRYGRVIWMSGSILLNLKPATTSSSLN